MEITANIAGRGMARVQIKDWMIAAVDIVGPIEPDAPFVSPGFVDIQVNGFAGIDFSDPDLDAPKASSILPSLWSTGVTTFCPTLITNSIDRLRQNFRTLEAARRLDPRFAAAVPCFHLEGPYLSSGGARGVHDPSLMKSPDWEEFSSLQQAGGGHIGIVTLAPELPGAFEFIRKATGAGIVVAVGHTDAAPEQIHQAVEAGARLSTHLSNGCPNLIHRHQNPLWAQLAEDMLSASLICDGFHIPPDLIRVVYKVKGIARSILITDAVHVAGLEPGLYQLVGRGIELLPSGQVVTDDRKSMAGSALSMNRAVVVFKKNVGVSLGEALQAATANPARLLGRGSVCTELELRQPANIVIFSPERNALHVEKVVFRGEQVYARPQK
jgi:N-acetylglucosamine-6-phosphate deacetylase